MRKPGCFSEFNFTLFYGALDPATEHRGFFFLNYPSSETHSSICFDLTFKTVGLSQQHIIISLFRVLKGEYEEA